MPYKQATALDFQGSHIPTNRIHSGSSTLGQILLVIRFAWKTVAEIAENRD